MFCIRDLPGIIKCDVTEIPLLFIDTASLDISELATPDEESKGNEGIHVKIFIASTGALLSYV